MYESCFNLHRRPFSTTPDPGCVFQPESIQTVIDELVICLERGEGIAVLTAPAGLGKTLLCEKVKQELGAGFVTILLRHADYQTSGDLLRTLLVGQGKSAAAETEQELRLQLLGSLTELRRDQKALVVICDEAHQLTEGVLEELRRLVDHADHGVPWVRLMLAGQLDLEEKLAGPAMSALNQRLRSHSTLSPLSIQDSLDYIDYRLTWAGGRIEEVFDPDALAAIVDAADGNPRCLNHLCDHVLLLAYVSEQRPVPPELVQEALADLQHLPLTWNIRAARTPAESSFASPPAPIRQSVSSAEFGAHLASWESTPSFSAADVSAALPQGEVWEFGADAEDFGSAPDPAPLEEDPFEHLLQAVESEIERAEAAREAEVPVASDVQEELVVDRYAAIDAGWPVEDLPPPEAYTKSSQPISIPTIAAPRAVEAEDRLHADVLELVTSTRNATSSKRFDQGGSPFGQFTEDSSSIEAIETSPPPTSSSERPFRNLFTRLRRKQKGLE